MKIELITFRHTVCHLIFRVILIIWFTLSVSKHCTSQTLSQSEICLWISPWHFFHLLWKLLKNADFFVPHQIPALISDHLSSVSSILTFPSIDKRSTFSNSRSPPGLHLYTWILNSILDNLTTTNINIVVKIYGEICFQCALCCTMIWTLLGWLGVMIHVLYILYMYTRFRDFFLLGNYIKRKYKFLIVI